MLSKMTQPNNVGGASGNATSASGRRVPMSLSASAAGAGSTMSRLQQTAGSNGRSNSPQNVGKRNDGNVAASGPFVSIKKSNLNPRSATTSSSSNASSASKDDEKKNQNGASKSTNSNQKSAQNGSSGAVVKEQQKNKEKSDKKEPVKETEPIEDAKLSKKDNEKEAKEVVAAAAIVPKQKEVISEIIILDDEPVVATGSITPTSERKSTRKANAANQQKTPSKAKQSEASVQKKQPETVVEKAVNAEKPPVVEKPVSVEKPLVVEDVEMEPLAVDASPVRIVPSAEPTATSTPGRNLFGFRNNFKQSNEVELAAQLSSSPMPSRTFGQISGRRSIRPSSSLTPGKMGNYRCMNNSDLDSSAYTNTSMNATVGSEIPNSSSFSFSFFGRGRKRERTPPPLSGSQSTNDLAQDVDMSPPKRARFELFSLNLASPFSMLRSRFSRAAISTPSSRHRHENTPPAGDDEECGEVQNVSGIIIQEEEQQQNLNTSTSSNEVTVGLEAGLETPKKSGTPENDVKEQQQIAEDQNAVADLPPTDGELPSQSEGPDRSRCAMM